MNLIKFKGKTIIFIDPGGCPIEAAKRINDEIKIELPYCVNRLRARAKNGFLQIGKSGQPGKSPRWHAVYGKKALQKRGLTI